MRKNAIQIIIFFWCLFFSFSCGAIHHNGVVKLQILGINDFHGSLEPGFGSTAKIDGKLAGGVEYLSTHIKQLREKSVHSVTVSAGDLFGASPLLSALFNERPTVEAMNILGLNINALGNHEFDMGWHKLKQLIESNNSDEAGMKLAKFDFLAANVVDESINQKPFLEYVIKEYGPIKVGFIGVLLKNAPDVIIHESINGLQFLDEAQTANEVSMKLEKLGVSTIVLLIHEGGYSPGNYNGCEGISGPIVQIVNNLNDNISAVLSGHTHQAYNCLINNKVVTSAASNGRLVTEVYLDIDEQSGKTISVQANNIIVTREVEKDYLETKLINFYQEMSAPIANKIVGEITESFTKNINHAGESSLGQIVADAQLASVQEQKHGFPKIALVNQGGIRADLNYKSSEDQEGDGKITFKEIYSVHPFGNTMVSMDLTGKEIIDILEEQFKCTKGTRRVLQVSKGFSYSYKLNQPYHERIIRESVMLEGKPLDPVAYYRIVTNNFLADGGDCFESFKKGIHRVNGPKDRDALESYLEKNQKLLPINKKRIFRLD